MGKSLRALIIEDSEMDTELMLRELQRSGYRVEFERVDTVDAMRALITKQAWDVILSDYSMPRFSVFQALDVLKENGLDIPFIIISGTIGEETAVAALKAGAYDFLVKKDMSKLGAAIEQALYGTKKRREHTRTKQAVQTGEELFGTAFRFSPIGICIMSLDGSLQTVSQSLADMLGYTQAELEGKHFSEITNREDIEIGEEAVGSMLSGRTSSVFFEIRYLHKTGKPIWALVSSSLLRDSSGRSVHFITHILNMTERKQAEEAFRESEARYRLLFESSMDAILLSAPGGRILAANPAACLMFGRTEEALKGIGRSGIIDLTDSRWKAALEKRAQTGSYRGELTFMRSNGTRFLAELSTNVFQLQDGSAGTSMIIRDITERKQAEEILKAKDEQVRLMSQQLWQAAKLATMGELAASIAHELNNPLATVSLRTEMLSAQFSPDDPESRSLQIIESEVKRMSGLVSNLLQFSRRSSSQVSTIKVHDEIINTLELIQYHLRKNSIRTIQELSSEVPLIQADRQQLRQVLLNLFTNAADAMPLGGMLIIRTWIGEKLEGGITAPLRPAITKSLGLPVSDVQHVYVEVSDTGEGISPDRLEHVWEPFYTTKPEGKGTGLGLAICRRIIQEHGGTIEIFSEGIPGKGTIVRLSLPSVKER